MSCPNVEWFELNFPILYLFRRHAIDAAGAGMFRGGVGAETAHTIYDAPEKRLAGVAYGVAGMRNSGHGIFGGYPGAPSVIKLVQNTRLNELFARGRSPVRLDELGGEATSLPYCDFEVRENDVVYMRVASGGGYGDPLERDPERVRQDVVDGIVSQQAARDIYGVVLNEDLAVDAEVTKRLRMRMRAEELKADESSAT